LVNEVRASHILVGSRKEADNLLNKLRAGARFEDLAKKHSTCPSGRKGGDLGYFRRGMMVREFETAAFSLNPGEVSTPIQTQFGFHLIKVVDKR
jgi:peptidyl-prolyl cis-trans isomerase C